VATCEVCGNDYDKTFEVHRNGETHVFDSFECAMHALATRLAVVGRGIGSLTRHVKEVALRWLPGAKLRLHAGM
jgi:hypothetical protein